MKKTRKPPHHAHMRHAVRTDSPPYVVRRSKIHGNGVYASRAIPKGARIVEYLGERITHAEADSRYEEKGQDDGHTFLFVVNGRVVIDAGVEGNDARYINHSCAPNCETVIEGGRVYIEARRDIDEGEELGYEYGLTWESTDDPDELANYACRCGAKECRGTMLDPEPLDRKRRQKAKRRTRPATRQKQALKADAGRGAASSKSASTRGQAGRKTRTTARK
jgi:SET domain-containing protein